MYLTLAMLGALGCIISLVYGPVEFTNVSTWLVRHVSVKFPKSKYAKYYFNLF